MARNCWYTANWRQLISILLVCSTHLVIAKPLQCPTNTTAAVQHFRGWDYQGCYHDYSDSRMLQALSQSSPDLTVANCARFCSAYGYTIFGVEFQHQCYCDNHLPLNATTLLADQVNCNAACSGDGLELCGGTWFIGVYQAHPRGRKFSKGAKIGVGLGLGFLVLFAAAIIVSIFYNRHRQSDRKSETPSLTERTHSNSGVERRFGRGACRPWKSCLSRPKGLLQPLQDGETQSDSDVLLVPTIVSWWPILSGDSHL